MDAAGVSVSVSVSDLTVRYPSVAQPALEGVSLELQAGELVGVVGATSAGKSTLLRCLNGIVPHVERAAVDGRILVAGLDPLTASPGAMSRRVGMVLDDPESQISQATVADEVALGMECQAVPWAEMETRVHVVLADVGLRGLERRHPTTLSGGEQQRLAIACAIALRPSVLLMDEPTAHLDPAGAALVFEIARRFNRDLGMTVVIASHDVERLAERADRIVVMDRGRMVANGPPVTVLERSTELVDVGVRVPQVTELAAAMADAAAPRHPWPVTLDEAVRWIGARR